MLIRKCTRNYTITHTNYYMRFRYFFYPMYGIRALLNGTAQIAQGTCIVDYIKFQCFWLDRLLFSFQFTSNIVHILWQSYQITILTVCLSIMFWKYDIYVRLELISPNEKDIGQPIRMQDYTVWMILLIFSVSWNFSLQGTVYTIRDNLLLL